MVLALRSVSFFLVDAVVCCEFIGVNCDLRRAASGAHPRRQRRERVRNRESKVWIGTRSALHNSLARRSDEPPHDEAQERRSCCAREVIERSLSSARAEPEQRPSSAQATPG